MKVGIIEGGNVGTAVGRLLAARGRELLSFIKSSEALTSARYTKPAACLPLRLYLMGTDGLLGLFLLCE